MNRVPGCRASLSVRLFAAAVMLLLQVLSQRVRWHQYRLT